MITWNLRPEFNDAVFRFVPPKGATQAQIVAPKTR
jgi:outer membrane lipoprotein-sorting protein